MSHGLRDSARSREPGPTQLLPRAAAALPNRAAEAEGNCSQPAEEDAAHAEPHGPNKEADQSDV